MDYKFNSEDTGISWDGNISLYHGNIDDKGNFDGKFDVQIKGRSTTNKALNDKWKFQLDKRDLENYNKVDGTLFLAVRFKKNGEYKIYFKALLPKNIRELLKEQPNSKNEIPLQLKEVKSAIHLERICRDFWNDKNIQKKLPDSVLEKSNLVSNNTDIGKFTTWNRGNFNPLSILGEEKFIYFSDDSNNIIDVKCVEINEVGKQVSAIIKDSHGKIYYEDANIKIEKNGEQSISFGNAFNLSYTTQKFHTEITGTLNERIKQLEFIINVMETSEFYINNSKIGIKFNQIAKDRFQNLYNICLKIKNFCDTHKINKDINLDVWSDKDIHQFLIWINAIDNHKIINIKEWKTSTMGSIQIADIRFSIIANILPNGAFYVDSIWNAKYYSTYEYTYISDDDNKISTQNIFSILNKEAYESDDINIKEMIEKYNKYQLLPREDELLNLQALEVIKAYDSTKNTKLLEYADFLLHKIKKLFVDKNIININLFQIIKRNRNFNDSELMEILKIKENSSNTQIKISANILLGNIKEAELLLNSLEKADKEQFLEFPIAMFIK